MEGLVLVGFFPRFSERKSVCLEGKKGKKGRKKEKKKERKNFFLRRREIACFCFCNKKAFQVAPFAKLSVYENNKMTFSDCSVCKHKQNNSGQLKNQSSNLKGKAKLTKVNLTRKKIDE